MLKGEYSHNIDAKGRLIIPAKFRDDLGENFVITKGMENCLYVPGNVRELRQKIMGAVLQAQTGLVTKEHRQDQS